MDVDVSKEIQELIQKVQEASDSKASSSEISQVLINLNKPKTVALGFWNEPPNEEMEKQKIVYLSHLAERGHMARMESLIQFVLNNEAIFRSCNGEKIRQICSKGGSPGHLYTPRSPVAKIILDTIFVLELILKGTNESFIKENDPIFLHGENLQSIIHDMFLLSNQIPFILLKSFYDIIYHDSWRHNNRSMEDEIASFMDSELCIKPASGKKYQTLSVSDNLGYNQYGEPEHLCAAVYNLWVQDYSHEFTDQKKDSYEFEQMHQNDFRRKRSRRQRVIRNATELQRAGIGFVGVDHRQTFSLKFRHGVIEIPVLTITTETEHFLRQCIAYEKNSREDRMRVIKDYCVVMDCLIHSTNDVQLLRENGVIDSYLHDDKDIVDLFDRLGERVPSSTNFFYWNLFDQINRHCFRRWNSWKASLRRNYLREDNQLEVVSFMFAIYIILPVTVVQTVYTVLSYYKCP